MRLKSLFTTASVAALGFAGAVSAGNELVVDQIGSDNFNDSGQSGSNLETLIQQNGNYNSSSMSNAGAASANDNLALRQDTSGNYATYGGDAGGSANNDFAVIQEGGNFNSAAVNVGGGNSNGNQVGIAQNGGQNTVGGGAGGNNDRGFGGGTVSFSQTALTMSQNSSNPLTLSADAQFEGTNNFVGMEQLGFQNVTALAVNGNNNSIMGSTSSNSPVSGRASIDFNGDFGSASIFDGSPTIDGQARSASLTPGGGVSGYVDTVTGNFAVQDGNYNEAVLQQDGNNNIIAWGQRGSFHTAEITQVGNNNFHQGGQSN